MRNPSSDPLVQRPTLDQFLISLQNWPWRLTVRSLRERFREGRLGLTAGSLTFTTLISLVPLLTVMLALFTAFPMFASFQVALEKYFLKSLIPDSIARPVLAALTQFASKASRLGAVGLIALGLSALALMLTIDRTLNQIWRVQRPRPIAQRVLVYWAAVTLGPLLLGGSLALTSYAITTGHELVSTMPVSLSLLFSMVQFLFLSFGVAALFHYVPNTDVRWRHALLGGVFVTVGFSLAKAGLAWYLKQVPTFSTLYGAFATVPIFLVWLYLGWVIVLLGALLAANAPSLGSGMLRRPEAPGLTLELCLCVLRELRDSQARGEGGLTSLSLARRLRVDPLQLEPVLDQLLDLNWLGRLDEAGAQRLVLLCLPEQTPAKALLQATLAVRSAVLAPLWSGSGWEQVSLAELLDTEPR
ncbi:YihY family inner membrane protein [Paucibacter sp. DJ2R-2]|uniref:YihY family inner membrane protein n=1 Tax=Paucibacter sp. DJ2R-2 TaxID=2893558 RepID=UPI0021E4B0FF|nr:YihY family inner membrane protein [Paucibacter sp. DJ2R-2]MCV2420538.1 YihY family inner membrane protein [Paucibacter sp. DJ4R-1]MCV2439716.1 YihY family inner membrane protein [Paucibacter sp. DJ2R-2]